MILRRMHTHSSRAPPSPDARAVHENACERSWQRHSQAVIPTTHSAVGRFPRPATVPEQAGMLAQGGRVMSSLPRRRRRRQPAATHQETPHTQARRLAIQLTPMQRHLVVQVGLPRWLHLSRPYHPPLGRSLSAALALASPEFGVLEPVPAEVDAYQLTLVGELVAGIWLTAALCDPEPLPTPSFRPSPHR